MFDNTTITNILKHINSGKDYKTVCLVSKQFYNIINQLFPGGDKFANHLLTLLKLFPDENWSYGALSVNPNITTNYLKNNLNKKWDWYYVTINSRFVLKDVLDNPEIPWVKHNILTNMSIPANNEELEFILQHIDNNPLYSGLIFHKGITWDIIINNLDKFGDYISDSPHITLNIIRNNPGLNWNFTKMSRNPVVTLEIVNEFIHENWDFYHLSKNKNIINHPKAEELFYNNRHRMNINEYSLIVTPEIVEKYPDLCWNYAILLQNHNITYDFTKKHPEIDWNYHHFSSNLNMNINILLENLDYDWDYMLLSGNFGIKINDILNNPSLAWNKKHLSFRKDLTWRIVANNPELFYFEQLSWNHFSSP